MFTAQPLAEAITHQVAESVIVFPTTIDIHDWSHFFTQSCQFVFSFGWDDRIHLSMNDPATSILTIIQRALYMIDTYNKAYLAYNVLNKPL
ncbi:hypothetical protein ABE354_08075 [Brevibacillus laterosporus]